MVKPTWPLDSVGCSAPADGKLPVWIHEGRMKPVYTCTIFSWYSRVRCCDIRIIRVRRRIAVEIVAHCSDAHHNRRRRQKRHQSDCAYRIASAAIECFQVQHIGLMTQRNCVAKLNGLMNNTRSFSASQLVDESLATVSQSIVGESRVGQLTQQRLRCVLSSKLTP